MEEQKERKRGKRLAHLFSNPSLVADVVNYTSVFDKEFKLHCFQLKQLSHNYSAKVCVHWHVVSSALLFGLLLAAVFSACVCGEQFRTGLTTTKYAPLVILQPVRETNFLCQSQNDYVLQILFKWWCFLAVLQMLKSLLARTYTV